MLFYIFAIVNNAAMNIGCIYHFLLVFSFSLDKYPKVKLLNLVTVYFIIEETAILFSIVALPIYIPTNSTKLFRFSTSLLNLLFLIFWQ